MRLLWTGLVAVLLLNLIAIAAGLGALWMTGRLDRERVQAIVDMVKMTKEEQAEQEALAATLEEENRKQAAEMMRLEAVSKGPVTLADQLRTTHLDEDASLHRANRTHRAIQDLQRQVELAKELIARERQQLKEEREAFDKMAERQARLKEDGDFRQAVQMYEKLKPKMAKQMFTNLLAEGKSQQVVNYLAAMKLRKAAAVLNMFKTPDEVAQATVLIQQLRERGIEPMDPGELASNLPRGGGR